MHAITIRQPWSSLVAIGAKKYETRTFAPPPKLIGQRIAIHAGAKKIDYAELPAMAISALLSHGIPGLDSLPRGAVIGTAVIAGAVQCGEMDGDGFVLIRNATHARLVLPDFFQSDPFGDYSPGRWAWKLTDVERFENPVPAKGKLGWWMWSDQDQERLGHEWKEKSGRKVD